MEENEYLENLELYLTFFDKIPDADVGLQEKKELMYMIGMYLGKKEQWETLKSNNYQNEKQTLKRQFEAEVKKNIAITKKFLIRLDEDLPILKYIPTISPEAKDEVMGYLESLQEIDFNEVINQVLHGERATKTPIEEHVRALFKKYNLKGVEDTVRELMPQI